MKKIILLFALLMFGMLFVSSMGQRQATPLKTNIQIKGQLETSAENKVTGTSSDTIYVDITTLYNFAEIDSIYFAVSLERLSGWRPADSLGFSPVQIRYIPILRDPIQDLRKGFNVNDTITVDELGAILEDSVETYGATRVYSFKPLGAQYAFIIEYNFTDTSNVQNGRVLTDYNIMIYGKEEAKATVSALTDSSATKTTVLDVNTTMRDSLNTIWTDSIKVGGINDSGLVLYIPGTANSDTSLFFDYSGQGNDGTNSGAKQVKDTVTVGLDAISCDGTNDFVSASITSIIDTLDTDYSFESWVWFRTTSGNQFFMDMTQTSGTTSYLGRFGVDGTNISFGVRDAGLNSNSASVVIPFNTNEWVYFVGTRKGDVVKLYINGELKDTESGSDIGAMAVDDYYTTLGAVRNSGVPNGASFLNGLTNESRIWERELLQDEIKDRFDNAAIHNLFQTKADKIIPTFSDTSGIYNVEISNKMLFFWDGAGATDSMRVFLGVDDMKTFDYK